jgi:hypothetical protein
MALLKVEIVFNLKIVFLLSFSSLFGKGWVGIK